MLLWLIKYLVCPIPGLRLRLDGAIIWIKPRTAVDRRGKPMPRQQKILSFEFSEVRVGASGRDRVQRRFCRRRRNQREQERRTASATLYGGVSNGGHVTRCWRRSRRTIVTRRPGPKISWRRNPNLEMKKCLPLFLISFVWTCCLWCGPCPLR